MTRKIFFLSLLGIALPLSIHASTYATCTTPADCKKTLVAALSFEYSTEHVKSYLEEELTTIKNAALDLSGDDNTAELNKLVKDVDEALVSLQDTSSDFEAITKKSEELRQQVKALNTENKDLSIYEKRQQSKYIELGNEALNLWKQSRRLIKNVDMSSLPDFVTIDEDVNKARIITSLEGTELVDRIFKFLNIEKYQVKRSW